MAAPAVIPVIAAGLGVAGFLGNFLPPLRNLVDQTLLKQFPNSIPDLNTILSGAAFDRIPDGLVDESLQKLGYNPIWRQSLTNATRIYLSAQEYTTLYRRGRISKEMFFTQMKKIGLNSVQAQNYYNATEYFPSPSDLVTFAVREVYTPDIAETFGIFEDIPEKFLTEASKAGLPTDQAKNYWGAHWDLPSPNMGFSMLHRGIIEKPDLEKLLKALDIMPYWREKLIDLSYNPLTRVDVRRMYRVGTLDKIGVEKAYKNIGYSPENAKLMTDFTIKYENDETDGLTRSTLLKAYKDSIISLEQFTEYLRALGYSDEVVDFWVDMATYEKTLDKIKLYTNDLIEQYRLGTLDISMFRTELLKRDLPTEYIDQVINDTLLLKGAKTKVPSQEDLQRWLKMGIIIDIEYVTKMRLKGFQDDDIESYLTEIQLERNTSDRTFLDIKTYNRWVQTGIISKERYIETLSNQNISMEDIQSNLSDLEVQ